ncbi:GIY-YIG nuclease family protein [Galbibacter pacificus]|uniref:GIY-YIG nuclease family protein n=1 Tax=Galbibacter pacificus TaxID=2996052 RepID=A0ABT6FPA4_9FLAO|nr:GIY-YIG nuclease family protein [Galbibacter pacificus]MDG3581577.1 GIY-YIG nuclease family protein [Galbibacter pacificus]MDG3585055.1 GIY-YIG nuclease family protein [Galbibacter pacificus]
MDYVVYILFSEGISQYYAGQTENIEKRIIRHNRGLVKSTKRGVPWKLIKIIPVSSIAEAMKLKRKVKKRGIKRFLADLT